MDFCLLLPLPPHYPTLVSLFLLILVGETGPELDWDVNSVFSPNILSKCMSQEEGYAFVEVGDSEKILDQLEVSIEQGRTTFSTPDESFIFSVKGTEVQAYQESEVNILINDPSFGPDGYYISCQASDLGCGINRCEMTHFANNEGDWFRVQFEGEIWVRTINPAVASYKPVRGVILTKK